MTTTTPTAPRELSAHWPGPTEGCLAFRVGYADETLPTSGITALVVALALRAVERPGLEVAATVGPTVTEFRVTGTGERVRTTLHALASALADLPVRHRASETQALADRTPDVPPVQSWRFGHRGYGLGTDVRVGLYRVTDEDLRSWARARFSATDALVWCRGAETPDLDVPLPAPAVAPHRAPEVGEAAWTLPAEALTGGTSVLWEGIVPDVPAAHVLAEVARRALFQNLRHDRGWTYDPAASVGALDGRYAALRLSAGLREETASEAIGEFLDTWGRLRHAVPADDLATAKAHLLLAFDEPHQEAIWLPDDAVRTLLGRPVPTPAERRAEIEAVTADDVMALARQAWDSGLLVAPVAEGWAGTAVVPRGAGPALDGQAFERIDTDATVVVGEEGATLRAGRSRQTVRFADTAALLAYPDGGRLLVGLDGAEIPFEPTLHDDLTAARVSALVDAHVPADRVVPVPRSGAPERPARQQTNAAAAARAARETQEKSMMQTAGAIATDTGRMVFELGKIALVGLLVLLMLAGVVGVVFAVVTVLVWVASWFDEGPQDWVVPAVVVPVGALCAVLTRFAYRMILRMGGEVRPGRAEQGTRP
ncbi:insulinase family protein [Promicromonospora sp. NPDC052451]|uniref:insulinase family protein n=1 Tax=Promicromonospora sp. NPDC052451 TaxID=3364407 RepID=UPI0037CA613D